jgi:hypothetical protein
MEPVMRIDDALPAAAAMGLSIALLGMVMVFAIG